VPKKQRKDKRKKAVGLTESQIQHLVLGWCIDSPVRWHERLGFPFKDETHRKEAWTENRDFLMTLRNDEPSFSTYPQGTRPGAWWDYDAPEPRKLISGTFVAIGDDLFRGIPKRFEDKPVAKWETEFQYLERLDLLFPGEKEVERKPVRIQGPAKRDNLIRLEDFNGHNA
jgi:hypothetical protein